MKYQIINLNKQLTKKHDQIEELQEQLSFCINKNKHLFNRVKQIQNSAYIEKEENKNFR